MSAETAKMTVSVEQLTQAALQLPTSERATLLERLLGSLDAETEDAVDQAWVQLAEDRIDAYDRGDLPSAPAEEVFARLKQR